MTKQVVKIDNEKVAMMAAFGLTEVQIKAINLPTPKCWVKKRLGRGGKNFEYIPVGVTIKYLNAIFGFGWSFEILREEIMKDIGQVFVKGRLTIHIKDKTVIREQFASKELMKYKGKDKIISIGDDLKAATSLCLTKCASLFGLFSDIYSSEFYSRIETPDGKPTVDESIDELKVDQDKQFKDLIHKFKAVIPKKRFELAEKALAVSPFPLTPKQKKELQALIVDAQNEIVEPKKPEPKKDAKPKPLQK